MGDKKKIKILALSDSASGMTGFGSVTRDVMSRLSSEDYEVHHVGYNIPSGIQTFKDITFLDGKKLKFVQYSGGLAPFAIDRVNHLIKKLKPDIFWCLLDSFMLFQAGYQNLDLSPCKFVFYFPSDGGGFPIGCESILRKADFPVAMSKYARDQVKEDFNIVAGYIPHGVDTKVYRPLKDKISCKVNSVIGHASFKDKFIVGSVFRNQPRKQPDVLLEGFKKFSVGKDDVVLLLHCDPDDPARLFDIRALVNKLGLQNKVFFTGMRVFDGFTLEQMNVLYNMMDVHVLSTSGEGFGVPTIESMACGVPNIVTNYTTTQELVLDTGAGLSIRKVGEVMGNWNVKRAIGDVDDLVVKLDYLYDNKEVRGEMGRKGVEAVKKFFDYDKVVVKQWDELFRGEVLK